MVPEGVEDPIRSSKTLVGSFARLLIEKIPTPEKVEESIILPIDAKGHAANPFLSQENDPALHTEALSEDIERCEGMTDSGECLAMANRRPIDLPAGVIARIEFSEQAQKAIKEQ